ncbi:hypothetical protein BN1323_350189 [Staphylococcus aureus]|nr:hypothetical protein SAET23_100012 [Staphylococcus aureus]CRI09863.1 hypothetical protein BN1322_100012 [Staphylococcus aureus]CRI16430.1 hypothetical protein SAET23_100012 [Staphylococcus aureus]CRI22576.1 hypothetical protein BN1323_350189 [Staphylococcus aureus]
MNIMYCEIKLQINYSNTLKLILILYVLIAIRITLLISKI